MIVFPSQAIVVTTFCTELYPVKHSVKRRLNGKVSEVISVLFKQAGSINAVPNKHFELCFPDNLYY